MPEVAAGSRQQKRAQERKLEALEIKQHGRPLTDAERGQKAIAEEAQFQALAHLKAKEFRDIIVGIRDEMVALKADLPNERQHKKERNDLQTEIYAFNARVCGARAYVIDTGLQLVSGVPNNPAEPPPPPIVKTATMEEAAALAKQKAELEASIK